MNDDPMPTDLPKTGMVEPRLIRGELHEPGKHGRRKKKSPWERHIELARQFPARWDPVTESYHGGWIECAAHLKGGPKARARGLASDRRRLMFYLNDRFPLDRFQIATRTDPGTWCDLRLYMRFLRTLTPEEDAQDRYERRQRYFAMMDRRKEVAAERELERRRAEDAQG